MREYQEAEIVKSLKLCYIAEVEKRGMKFIDDKATNERIETAAMWMCSNSKPGIMLFGRVGSGKSTLARAMAQLIRMLYDNYSLGEKRICIVCGSALDLNTAASNKDLSEFGKYKFAKFLSLDDVGCEPSPTVKAWGNDLSPIMDLIFYRYESMRPTIITSNLSLSDMRKFYGDRVGDRMLEMFNGIEFKQTLSYRK